MADQPSRKRRIVRRVMWTVAVVVLLGCCYVNLFFVACWADSRMIPSLSGPCWNGMAVFDPLLQYGRSELPAARDFEAFTVWVLNGRSGPLSAEYEWCDQMRKQMAKDRASHATRAPNAVGSSFK